jgi:pimeloyl-ACP methyl ester carboxylesterase
MDPKASTPMTVDDWAKEGSFHSVRGHRLFAVDTGGDKPPLVVLHGYPTSSHDYHRVLPKLAERHRVIVHDHLGFGLSDKPAEYSYSLLEQTDHAVALWQALGVRRAHLVAHDYGTSIATELVARRNEGDQPIELASLTLSNGSVHIELAKLRLIQKLLRNRLIGPIVARLSSKRVFRSNMRKLWADPSRLGEEEIGLMWALLTRDHGKNQLSKITQYLRERVRYWDRWVGALRACDLPTHVLWGAEDPITGRHVARVHHDEIAKSTLTLLDGVGHYPMLEAPDRWADALTARLPA